jgi:hypothetical protein
VETTQRLAEVLSRDHGVGLDLPSAAAIAERVDPKLHRNRATPGDRDLWLTKSQQMLLDAMASGKILQTSKPLPGPSELCLNTLRSYRPK